MDMAKIQGLLVKEVVFSESSDTARDLNKKSLFGTLQSDGRVQLSLLEALYLVEKKKLEVLDGRKKPIPYEKLFWKARRSDSNFFVRYQTFKDLRARGYIVKTALKFGADFRVYERGVKPGEDHAKWVVFPVHEGNAFTWQEFSAKNRVAHSTKKRLMIAVVDDEGDVSYWEVRWLRP